MSRAVRNELEVSRGSLETMGFEFAAASIGELAERAVREELTLLGFLNLVLSSEREHRQERRVRTALKLSGLALGKTLDDFDFLFQNGVDKAKVICSQPVSLPSGARTCCSWGDRASARPTSPSASE